MESFYLTISYITAGIALLSGIINVMAGLFSHGERSDLYFGLICLCGFLFIVLPPGGLLMKDVAPYPLNIEIKRIFIWLYYMLLPFFIEEYTKYKNRGVTYAAVFFLVVSYIIMTTTNTDRTVWFWISRVALTLVLWNGISGSLHQLKRGEKTEARWLLAAMVVYGVLLVLSMINEAAHNVFGRALQVTIFFPMHLNIIAFIVIISIRLRVHTQEKYNLEKVLNQMNRRWKLLVQNMHLLVIEMDREGKVIYANPYALKKLGAKKEEQVVGKVWFETFSTAEEARSQQERFINAVREKAFPVHYSSKTLALNGNRIVIRWTNVFVQDATDSITGMISIGMDTTEQEKAYQQVRELKYELDRENLITRPVAEDVSDEGMLADAIGKSEAFLYVVQKCKLVSNTNASVLLLGETGAGKEMFAGLIHRNSYRAEKPFIKVNCAALPAELIESELFGHEKGSFTGAVNTRKGKFEMANGGTIFLDEIGELPLALQSKLLRVLQSGEFERVGGQQLIKVDVRVISATNRNLRDEVKAGHFREDLFYRLNVYPVTIPSLRKRRADIPLLVAHYLKYYAGEHNKQVSQVSKADMIRLTKYPWPGNIRELKNLIERSVINSRGDVLVLDWQGEPPSISDTQTFELAAEESIESVEKAHILRILEQCHWKINGADGAAVRLGLHPSTLRSKLKKHQIDRAGT